LRRHRERGEGRTKEKDRKKGRRRREERTVPLHTCISRVGSDSSHRQLANLK